MAPSRSTARHPRDRLAALRAPAPMASTDAETVGAPEPMGEPSGGEPPGAIPPSGSAGEAQTADSRSEPELPAAGALSGAVDGPPVADAAEPVAARSRLGPARAVGGAAGRLVRRWMPGDAARWRFDPGRRPALALTAVVLLAAVVAGVVVWRSRPVAEPAPALAAVEVSGTAQAAGSELVVSVAGQVVHPGLVRLQPGARVADAIEAAGGPAPGTDLTGVNLARRLSDGEHVVVGPAAPAQPAAATGAGSRLDLNTATLAELDALPGVGPVTARRILDWRAAHGRFASVDQLREVDGIGEARFTQLRDLVTA